jgi:tRNA(Ile)-lysidine synthase|tara:strand:- start:1217 stop:2644 length:1428 start_codon:yes stop_codon:yes gene_type:complete
VRQTIYAALQEAGVDPRRSILVAVSGGADSMTALDALQAIGEDDGPRVVICHFNHRMRGEDADADEEYVRTAAESRGLAYLGDGADVASYAKDNRLSMEDAARRLRYGFLGRAAEQESAQAAITGHTLDDQAETVLLHIVRGSGLTGVRGMRLISRTPRRWGGGALTIIRPLLRLRREDTEQYCSELGIIPRLDVSNESTTFARNRLRLNVMPELEAINPRVAESIIRLSDTAAEELAALQEVIDELWKHVLDNSDSDSHTVTLDRALLKIARPALRRSLLRRAFVEASGTETDLQRSHITEMDRLAEAGAGRSIDLPHRIRFETRSHTVMFAPAGREDAPYPGPIEPIIMSVPGRFDFPGGETVEAKLVDRPGDLDAGSDMLQYADADAIEETVTLRNRVDGDRFQPLGMDTETRLKDLFVNSGVPKSWREGVPIMECERGIAWIAGLRIAEWARVTPETKRVLRISLATPDRK